MENVPWRVKTGWVAVSDLFTELEEAIETTYAPGRERSICFTNLEQAEMWLHRAVLN